MMKKTAQIIGLSIIAAILMMGTSTDAQNCMQHKMTFIGDSTACLSNRNNIQHFYGDWQGTCIPMLSVGENCCSTIWEGVPISSTDVFFENDTLHVILLLTKQKRQTSYLIINLYAANNTTCHVDFYEETDYHGRTRYFQIESKTTCKLSKDER